MKTAVSIPNHLFEEGDQLAKELGLSRSALYAQALASLVQTHRESDTTRRLNEIYDVEDGSLDPVIEALQSRAIEPEDW